MDKSESSNKTTDQKTFNSTDEASISKNKPKMRGTKRKRKDSDSSSDGDGILPENMLEMEKNLHASALKNNLDEISVRKILKKVVTNDHVLALVKLREEEENGMGIEDQNLPAKLTRSRAKELMKVSPKTAPWNLELTPIKHIPVKTRPEVKALIAQELPEDEDDDEYQPTHEDVQSDDDHTLESCSDLESQPRTPATPKSQQESSPKVIKDGPFKVPQSISATKRKIDLEEEATIALRTRSKLSLSSTSIEHIESTFVPPDELPTPAVDDLWNQFLSECLDPASASRNEEDDEADPEYNVAADADALDEDEEALGNSIIKISKKELNDLVTELFNIMPEATVDDGLAENLANSVLTDTSQNDVAHWEGKQEPLSDEEVPESISKRLTFEKRDTYTRVSIGKSEIEDAADQQVDLGANETEKTSDKEFGRNTRLSTRKKAICDKNKIERDNPTVRTESAGDAKPEITNSLINISIREGSGAAARGAPAVLRALRPAPRAQRLHVSIAPDFRVLPEQILILQQQIRQHVQLAAFNFLELYVHPIHWKLAPTYKGYLETLNKMGESNPDSVVNVCNLKPAIELIASWEKTVSEDSAENKAMIKFIVEESEKCRRRIAQNNGYWGGHFHETLLGAVSHSPVFVYPHLLPPGPYRPDFPKKVGYLRSEDELIALGLDQFWRYVEDNPKIFKVFKRRGNAVRMGVGVTAQLISKHMFPWLSPHSLVTHIAQMRRLGAPDNPIYKFMRDMKSPPPLAHRLLPFSARLTLHAQPAAELPRAWLRHLAADSARFKEYLHRSGRHVGVPPPGVPVVIGQSVDLPEKQPLPIHFNKQIVGNQPDNATPTVADKFDLCIQSTESTSATEINTTTTSNMMVVTNIFTVVETSTGSVLVPLALPTNTGESNPTTNATPEISSKNNLPECSSASPPKEVKESKEITQIIEVSSVTNKKNGLSVGTDPFIHCECCELLRKIESKTQRLITDYFRHNKRAKKTCLCRGKRYPKISNRLRLFMSYYQSQREITLNDIEARLKESDHGLSAAENDSPCSIEDVAYVTSYQVRLEVHMRKIKALQRTYIKSLFSKFGNDADVTKLMDELYKMWNKDFNDLYQDFFGLLTAGQADEIGAFKYYFLSRIKCFIAKIDEEVKSKEVRDSILKELKSVLYGQNDFTSCEMCTRLLTLMTKYPPLAQYTFSCFPHRKDWSCTENLESESSTAEEQQNVHTLVLNTEQSQHINSPLGQNDQLTDTVVPANLNDADRNIQTEPVIREPNSPNLHVEDPIKVESQPTDDTHQLITAIKNEPETQDYACDSPTSMVILEDDVKSETLEWTRDEDKIVLEVLQQCLTLEERKDKTIVEVFDEQQAYEIIVQKLPHKNAEDLRDRMLYLLELLLLNED